MKPYRMPNELKINRMVAENARTAIGNILEQDKRYDAVKLLEYDREALRAFVELMDDKDNRTIEFLKQQHIE